MQKFNTYQEAENYLFNEIINNPEFITEISNEKFCSGFILLNPLNNKNSRSNYFYADEFFKWLLTGQKQLSNEIIELNPWVKRFVDKSNLPENFSASYGFKIKEQIEVISLELQNKNSRRAYLNILYNEDKIILNKKTTHEYPCTIGIHYQVRNNILDCIVNMRSNNCYSVMPYDVYNFTLLQKYIADKNNFQLGIYYHQINNAHIFKGDIKRIINN